MSPAAAKFDTLRRAAEVARVPPTVFLDEAFFAALIRDDATAERELDDLLAEIAMTSGAVLDRHLRRLGEVLSGLRITAGAEDLIARTLGPLLPDWATRPLAVRSAARVEDQAARSSAGIYDSFLNVQGPGSIAAALLAVWRSYFSRAALVERLAAGVLADGRRMTAMVQPMVPARAAGVAFSADPVTGAGDALCEYTAGLADRLVSGAVDGRRLRADEEPKDPLDPLGVAGAQAVFSVLERLQRHFRQEIDVEWVWDGSEVHVVQVRPISTLAAGAPQRNAKPVLDIRPLYDAADEDLADFQPLPEFARYFRAKRRPLQLLAHDLGLPRRPALLLRYNRAGIERPEAGAGLAVVASRKEVVVDASDRVRQMIVPGSDVLNTLLALVADRHAVGIVALRAFVAGDIGFITQPREDGSVALEYSAGGLLALNRGTAHAHFAILASGDTRRPDWLDKSGSDLILRAVAAARACFGPTQIEWVKDGDDLIMLDYSPLSATLGADPSVIGTGFAHAPVVRLEDTATLTDMSEGPSISITSVPRAHDLGAYVQEQLRRIQSLPAPPILVCRRPYALLAALIPHVAGFVFQSAPLLSHLSILIRENRKPALASPEVFAGLSDGDWFMLDLPRAQAGARNGAAS